MSRIRPPRLEGTIHLGDGRQLGYAEYGPATGRPLIWLHGTPGARRQIAPEAREIAHQRDIRIVAVERPGTGLSTPHLYSAVGDFAADVRQVSDALELDRFGIAGLSGGGPYALACAYHMRDRVVAVALLGGVAPAVGDDAAPGGMSDLARLFSPMLARTSRPLSVMMRGLVRALEPVADQAIDLFASFMPPGDKRVFADDAVREMFVDDIVHGSRRHMQALFLDAVLFGRHWGFPLDDIDVPVHMWYGDADNIVPSSHGVHMAAILPKAVICLRPEEGHLGGLGASHEIIDAIIGHWDDANLPGGARVADEAIRRS